MFFIIGISNGQKKLDFTQTIMCSKCGNFGRYEVLLTYTYLSLFFIPVLKWGRKYYVTSTCCNTIYTIDEKLGKKIASGECTYIPEEELHLEQSGHRCFNCGYQVDESFQFCPRCGQQLKSDKL